MQSELVEYHNYLQRLPISGHKRRNYFLRVRCFLDWLADTLDRIEALANDFAQDVAVKITSPIACSAVQRRIQ